MAKKPIDLDAIEAAKAEAAAAEAGQKSAREKVSELNSQLYEKVASGESTGDSLTDFVIRRNFGHNPEAVELFRSLEEKVAAHVGEPVVIVSRGIDHRTHTFPGGLKDPYVTERIGIGILSGAELIFDHEKGEWSFPTDVHYSVGSKRRDDDGVVGLPLTTAPPEDAFFSVSPLEGAWNQPMDLEPGTSKGFVGIHEDGLTRLQIGVGEKEAEALIENMYRFDKEAYETALDQLLQLPTASSES